MDDPFDLPPDVLGRIPLFAELSKVLSWSGGPVNWDLARQIATSVAAGERPPEPASEHDEEIAGQVRVAELWLTETTGALTPSHLTAARAATTVEWADHACSALAELIDPVAAKVASAMSSEVGSLAGGDDSAMVAQALSQMAPMFMGIQAGTIIGNLARDVSGVHDLGLPAGEGEILLVVSDIDAVAAGSGLDRTKVRQYVAVRAAAHRMIFEGFPRTRFFALYHNYVASLRFDFSESVRRLQELDLSDPSRVQDALGDEALFAHDPSPESRSAADEIAMFLSLVGAHIDIATAAASTRLGDIASIREALARRAHGAGAGSQMLERFIGLREAGDERARTFVHEVLAVGGWELLNRVWEDPMAFPTQAEVADPETWRKRVEA